MSGPELAPLPLASLTTDKSSMGCGVLDLFFKKGVPCGCITEFVGESTVAKSQLCMQLMLHVQLPVEYGGLGGSAVYVYTEGVPAYKRLQEMAFLLHFKHPPEALTDMPDPLAHIFVETGFSSGQDVLSCLHRIRRLLQEPPRARPVRLIVVDSMAAVFRDVGGSPGAEELASRTELLFRISTMLRRYAHDYNLAVVVTNQVMDAVGEGAGTWDGSASKHIGHTGGVRLMSGGREVIPALGLAWSNCVNLRVFMSRENHLTFAGPPSYAEQAAQEAGWAPPPPPPPGPLKLRKMTVVFSPSMPRSECFYLVEHTGLRGLHPREFDSLEYNPYHHLAAAAGGSGRPSNSSGSSSKAVQAGAGSGQHQQQQLAAAAVQQTLQPASAQERVAVRHVAPGGPPQPVEAALQEMVQPVQAAGPPPVVPLQEQGRGGQPPCHHSHHSSLGDLTQHCRLPSHPSHPAPGPGPAAAGEQQQQHGAGSMQAGSSQIQGTSQRQQQPQPPLSQQLSQQEILELCEGALPLSQESW